jgi:putative PIN family toxin of toxin-antitoxin system
VIRVVLDANVIVSGFPASRGTMAELVDQWRAGTFQLVVSEHIIDEVSRAWTKTYWQTRFSQAQIDRALLLLREESDITPITVDVSGFATHPEDDLVLATAANAGADYLITGTSSCLVSVTFKKLTSAHHEHFLNCFYKRISALLRGSTRSDRTRHDSEANQPVLPRPVVCVSIRIDTSFRAQSPTALESQ